MQIVHSIQALRKVLQPMRQKGFSIGVVPTMGALHAGHMNLVKKSAQKCDVTVVTIFVNPLQFGANEDLDKYPRCLDKDAELCAENGAQVVFAPQVSTMYHPDHATYVVSGGVEDLYCGAHRPGHFRGVLTIVAKLFLAVQPDWAFFGKKDYQQVALISRMTEDLNFPIRIGLVPTARESSGLARSSRNEYLSTEDRSNAAGIYAALKEARGLWKQGELKASALKSLVTKRIKACGGVVQYVELASRSTLLPLKGRVQEPCVMLVAAHFGATRLIDNLEF